MGCKGALEPPCLKQGKQEISVVAQATVRGEKGFAYTGLINGILCVTRDEGIRGLFQGLNMTVLRSVVSDFATVFFGEFMLVSYRHIGGRNEGMAAIPLRTIGGCASILLTLPL